MPYADWMPHSPESTALRIFMSHEYYQREAEEPDFQGWAEVVSIPLSFGRLNFRASNEGGYVVSWCKPLPDTAARILLEGGRPKDEEWTDDGPLLWVIDYATFGKVTASGAVKDMAHEAIVRGLASVGEKVYFNRQGRRVGFISLRG